MGLGDWILATGEAKRHHALTGQSVCFMTRRGRPQWDSVFENNPKIVRYPGRNVHIMFQGGGERPYIHRKRIDRWEWKPYKPIPGELFFTDAEKEWAHRAKGYVIVEPHVKNIGHSNKDYGWEKWLEFSYLWNRLSTVQLLQMGAPEARRLPRVRYVVTPTFRDAAAVLSGALAIVTTDGALHHAAAAVNTPAVVLWSEYTSPDFLGYDTQVNLRHAGPACGNRMNCSMCRQAMEKISAKEVVSALKGVIGD